MSRLTNGPKTSREARILSAGMYAGMRNVYMARAAGAKGSLRGELIKAARDCHHTYLARLREANGAPGYYVPPVAPVEPAPLAIVRSVGEAA